MPQLERESALYTFSSIYSDAAGLKWAEFFDLANRATQPQPFSGVIAAVDNFRRSSAGAERKRGALRIAFFRAAS